MTLYQIAVGDLDRPLTGDWESQVSSDILRDDVRRCVCQAPADRWPRAADLSTCGSQDGLLITHLIQLLKDILLNAMFSGAASIT